MTTRFAHVLVIGGIVSRSAKPGSAFARAENTMMTSIARALPQLWGAGVTAAPPGAQTLFFTVPHRSRKQFAKVLADFLAEMDRQIEGFMANRFIVTDLGKERNAKGYLIYDGGGLGLGQQILFWTGVDWMIAKPSRLDFDDQFHQTYLEALLD